MANKIYPKYKKAAISGGPTTDLMGGNVKFVLIDTTAYTYADTDEFLSDISGSARVSISGALTSKSVSDVAAFASAIGRFIAVVGPVCAAIAMFIDTGAPTSSRLVAYYDSSVTGLPLTPTGADENVVPDAGSWLIL